MSCFSAAARPARRNLAVGATLAALWKAADAGTVE
jgi:hypothetical protein